MENDLINQCVFHPTLNSSKNCIYCDKAVCKDDQRALPSYRYDQVGSVMCPLCEASLVLEDDMVYSEELMHIIYLLLGVFVVNLVIPVFDIILYGSGVLRIGFIITGLSILFYILGMVYLYYTRPNKYKKADEQLRTYQKLLHQSVPIA